MGKQLVTMAALNQAFDPPDAMFMSQDSSLRDARYHRGPLSDSAFAGHGQSHTCASIDQSYDRGGAYQRFSTPHAASAFQGTSLGVRSWYKPRLPYSRHADAAAAGGAWQGNKHRQPGWQTLDELPVGAERIAPVLMNGSSMAVAERAARAHSQDTAGRDSKDVVTAGCLLGNPRAPVNYRASV